MLVLLITMAFSAVADDTTCDACSFPPTPADTQYICDQDNGGWLHWEASAVSPVSPPSGCHSYVYITAKSPALDACEVGKSCSACTRVQGTPVSMQGDCKSCRDSNRTPARRNTQL